MAIFLAAAALGNVKLPRGLQARASEILAVAGDAHCVAESGAMLVYCDLGIWPGSSAKVAGDSLALIAGDPVLCAADGILTRQAAITEFAERGVNPSILVDAQGTYCGLVWNRKSRTFFAFTDKLGVRPVYYAQAANVVYISNAQWVLEALTDLPKAPDWRGVAECAAFGFPLADRTLFSGMKTLYAGEMCIADVSAFAVRRYWDWNDIQASNASGAVLVDDVRRSFNAAVDSRIRNQKQVMAFLSGGMDSRMIVSRLRQNNVEVHTLNFAPQGSQDFVFGGMAAVAMGTEHFEFGGGSGDYSRRQVDALNAWKQAHPNKNAWPESPHLFWAGDGGSVTLGHVYLNEEMLRVARNEGSEAAARVIQRHNRLYLPSRAFRRKYRQAINFPLQGIVEDLSSRPKVEAGRNCHYFFMLNDQRRHLVGHYENIHLKRTDLVLPFFDGRFLATVLGSPIDPFMRHALYNELMLSLPQQAGQVPWQAYPGHMPCPIPYEGKLRRQWQDSWLPPSFYRREKRKEYKVVLRNIMSSAFPAQVLNRVILFGICLMGIVRPLNKKTWFLNVVQPYMRASRTSAEARPKPNGQER